MTPDIVVNLRFYMSFDITANFSEDFADYPRVESAVNNAIAKWESIITGDLPDVTNAQVEGVGAVSVDDIRIDFDLENGRCWIEV